MNDVYAVSNLSHFKFCTTLCEQLLAKNLSPDTVTSNFCSNLSVLRKLGHNMVLD